MTRRPLILSSSYLAAVRAIRALHHLTRAGLDESPEADAVRDASDGIWPALSEVERKRIRGLSEDLYSLSEPSAGTVSEQNPQAQARLNDAIEARQHGDWDRALELLRRWGKHLSPALASFLRGSIWREAGDPETAVLFHEHAARLEPNHSNYLPVYLTVLGAVDPAEARRQAEEILRDPDRYSPAAVVRAAHVILSVTPRPPAPEASQVSRQLIPLLQSALATIERGDEAGLDRFSYGHALSMLGICHEAAGNVPAAVECYSRALQGDPDDHALLLARGMIQYGTSHRAITDLERAVENGSPVFLPYFLLAHHYLVSQRFRDAHALCMRAAQMPAPLSIQSELAEWTAIAQAELSFPAEMVRASFENAIRLDPSNDRAQRNLGALEGAMPPTPPAWQIRSAAEVRTSGQVERQLAMAA